MRSEMNILTESIKRGISIERKGEEFYTDVAGKIDDPLGKDTLRFLAKEEGRHIQFLENLLDTMVNGNEKELSRVVAGYEGQLTRSTTFPTFPGKEEYVTRVKVKKGDKEILKEARKIEKRSIAFYQEAVDTVNDEEHKSVFRLLEDWEKKHLDWIEFMDESMDLYGYWTGIQGYFANE